MHPIFQTHFGAEAEAVTVEQTALRVLPGADPTFAIVEAPEAVGALHGWRRRSDLEAARRDVAPAAAVALEPAPPAEPPVDPKKRKR